MIVEDSDDYAFLLSRALNHSRRFQVVWRAKDGQEAISYLAGTGQFGDRQRFPYPEAMLLDLGLPRKDGFEVMEWVAAQKVKPKTVMLTVLENEHQRHKALQAGADAFEVKPYEEEHFAIFLKWLDEWIGEKVAAAADEPQSRIRSPKQASPGKHSLRGSTRGECESDRHRR